ncbi:MAG: hypothetical protein GEU81_16240 [Nitriliruptorales bacterium]|nr:hypothetical protein [Nitriliruptorales bacterium]
MTPRRPPIFGPEPWAERAAATWSHWDLWFCLVCLIAADGDWTALEEEIIRRDRRRSVGGRTWERKRSHLLDLCARLDRADLNAADLAGDALDDKPLRTKARRKVLDQDLAGRDHTPAMQHTPRRRLRTRAYRGHWAGFPVSPAEACDQFAAVIEDSTSSFRLAMDLDAVTTEEHDRLAGVPARQLALWRGLLTAGLEGFLHGLRDSDGAVATHLGEGLATYTELPWRDTGIDPAVYWTDLCEWCIWEDWGIRHRREKVPFRNARRDDVPVIERLLWALEAEHRSHRLDYEADEAVQLVAWLAVATRSFHRFVPLAERLRADWWTPVDAMGQAAAKAGQTDLAVAVYSTAIAGGGWHVEHLTRRCQEVTGGQPPHRHLRRVE